MQKQFTMTGELAPCPGCGKQPKGYNVLGGDTYFLECAPCQTRTARAPTMQQAIEHWEAGERVGFSLVKR